MKPIARRSRRALAALTVASQLAIGDVSGAAAGYLVCVSRQRGQYILCSADHCRGGDRLDAFSSQDHPACEHRRSAPGSAADRGIPVIH
jgi:hypothetical protein